MNCFILLDSDSRKSTVRLVLTSPRPHSTCKCNKASLETRSLRTTQGARRGESERSNVELIHKATHHTERKKHALPQLTLLRLLDNKIYGRGE